jgi:putative membrane protein
MAPGLIRVDGGVPLTRRLAMLTGAGLIALGATPLCGPGFTGHVGAHLLLGMLGPFVLVLGDPFTVALGMLAPSQRRAALRTLHHPVVRALSRPGTAWAAAVLGPWLLWLTPLYGAASRHELLHGLVHLHFVLAGVLFASVVLGAGPLARDRGPATGAFLLGITLPVHALLGLVLMSMDRPRLGIAHGGVDALTDQRRGATLMWVGGDAIATVMLGCLFPRWRLADQRRARQEDLAVAAGEATDG